MITMVDIYVLLIPVYIAIIINFWLLLASNRLPSERIDNKLHSELVKARQETAAVQEKLECVNRLFRTYQECMSDQVKLQRILERKGKKGE